MTATRSMLAIRGGKLRFYKDHNPAHVCCATEDPSALCAECRAAYDEGVQHGWIKPKPRAAAKPATVEMRAAVGADGRTAEERKADAELVRDLRKLGVGRLTEEPAADRTPTRTARRQRPTYAPRGYSAALGRNVSRPRGLDREHPGAEPLPEPTDEERAENEADDRTVDQLYGIIRSAYPDYPEDSLFGLPRQVLEEWVADIEARRDQADEEFEAAVSAAEDALPRGYTKAMAAKRTELQKADAEIRAASRSTEIEGGLFPYSREIARRETLAEIRAGRQERLERARKFDPTTPPRGYTEALRRRQEVAA